jgi:hypothetical protein
MASEKTIDGYADALTDWRGEAVRAAADAIRAAAPEAAGTIKWASRCSYRTGRSFTSRRFPRP